MSFVFKKAVREQVGLLIGCVGGTGAGKTLSAMRLATGMSGGKPFAVIDTEAGRAKHYAGDFSFDHGDLRAPFRPDAYVEAIKAADAAGYPVIVVDSMSHVWAGDGGCLDWQEEEFQRMGGRDSVKIASWIKPKMSHKHMVQKLLQIRAHLILCFRAEQKIEIVREDGKTKIVQKESLTGLHGWIPICEKNLPFELTASLLFTADAPGIPKPIKLNGAHRKFIPLDRPVDENVGKQLAAWAAGGEARVVPDVTRESLMNKLRDCALAGHEQLRSGWSQLTAAERKLIGESGLSELKALADKQQPTTTEGTTA